MCTDCNSTTLPEGIAGDNGWSPKLAVVTVTCDTVEHEILKLVSWVGGSGTRPFYLTNEMTDTWLTANPVYLSSTGWTLSGCAATFIEGTDGSDATITVEETDGIPTGTPNTFKFGPGTLSYPDADNVIYDPEGDWTNIAYTSGDIVNGDSAPYYTSTSTAGVLIVNQAFRPYIGAGSDYTIGDPPIRRLKYKINDDKTITLEGHIECQFTTNNTTLNLHSGTDAPLSASLYATPRCLVRFNFITALTEFGTSVRQYPCTILVSQGAIGTNISTRTSKGSYPGLINLTKDFMQIECLHPTDITVTSATTHTVNVIIAVTFAKRSGV